MWEWAGDAFETCVICGKNGQVDIPQHPTESDGWDLKDEEYIPIWHQGEQLPDDSLLPQEHEMSKIFWTYH